MSRLRPRHHGGGMLEVWGMCGLTLGRGRKVPRSGTQSAMIQMPHTSFVLRAPSADSGAPKDALIKPQEPVNMTAFGKRVCTETGLSS